MNTRGFASFLIANLICLTGGFMLSNAIGADSTEPAGQDISLSCDTKEPFLRPGTSLSVNILVKNKADTPLSIDKLSIEISDVKGNTVYSADVLKKPLKLESKSGVYRDACSWAIPAETAPGSFFVKVTLEMGTAKKEYPDVYFFKVLPATAADTPLKVYNIEKKNFKGLDVYCLDGGMSAEFAIEKTLDSLSCGISHSWYPERPGSGPRPVYASPNFLKESLQKTIAYYDALGENRVYDTVIIGAGVASAPYLSRVTKAPFLPIHFLAAANSGREISALLNNSNADHSISSYAVLGYDFSMRDMAVAWIKLLDIPEIYLDFIKRHKVQNVVFLGSTGIIGETLARRIMQKDGTENSPIAANDIFLLYTSSSSTGYGYRPNMDVNTVLNSKNYKFDMENFTKKLSDLSLLPLEKDFRRIADWESGMSKEQISNYKETLAKKTEVSRCILITAAEDGDAVRHLYNLATYLMLSFYKKNAANNCEIKGIVMNPYLTSHPFYESVCGYVPFLFWQGQKNDFMVKELTRLLKEFGKLAPENDLSNIKFFVNISKNFNMWNTKPEAFKKLLGEKFTGIPVEITDNTIDEAWNETDDKKSSTEKMAENLAELAKSTNLKKWEDSMQPLSLDEIKNINKQYPKILVEELINKNASK